MTLLKKVSFVYIKAQNINKTKSFTWPYFFQNTTRTNYNSFNDMFFLTDFNKRDLFPISVKSQMKSKQQKW